MENLENRDTLKKKLKYWKTHWAGHPAGGYALHQVNEPAYLVRQKKDGIFLNMGCAGLNHSKYIYLYHSSRHNNKIHCRLGFENFLMNEYLEGSYYYGRTGSLPDDFYVEETDRSYRLMMDISYSSKSLLYDRISCGQLIKYINGKFSYFSNWDTSILLAESHPPRTLTLVDRYWFYGSFISNLSIVSGKNFKAFFQGKGSYNRLSIRGRFTKKFFKDLVNSDLINSIYNHDKSEDTTPY